MARNFETDYLHRFRFGVAFDGQLPLGFCKVAIQPSGDLKGPGTVVMEAAWTPLIIDFLQQQKRSVLDVSAFRMPQDITSDPADLTFRLRGVVPACHRFWPISWDAAATGILLANFEIDYACLELIEGEIKLFEPNARPLHVLDFDKHVRRQPRVKAKHAVFM